MTAMAKQSHYLRSSASHACRPSRACLRPRSHFSSLVNLQHHLASLPSAVAVHRSEAMSIATSCCHGRAAAGCSRPRLGLGTAMAGHSQSSVGSPPTTSFADAGHHRSRCRCRLLPPLLVACRRSLPRLCPLAGALGHREATPPLLLHRHRPPPLL